MKEIIKECNLSYFFWVDCIFLNKEQKQKAIEIFNKYEIDFHYNDCIIDYKKHKHNVEFEVINKEDGEMKSYFFRYSKQMDLSEKITDFNIILDKYNTIKENYSTYKVCKAAAGLNLQYIDILKIRNSFSILEEETEINKCLIAIIEVLKNDIGMIFDYI
jgi:hypothetical protein